MKQHQWPRPGEVFNETVRVDILFRKGTLVLHMIDECTRYSMCTILRDQTPTEICRAMSNCWFRVFQPPRLILADQEGALISDEAGIFLGKHDVQLRTKPTELHATMIERHNALLRRLLHIIDDQVEAEGLHITDEDIVAETCYAKSNMLEVGGAHPITAVLGIKPHVLPDFESSSLALTDDYLGSEFAASRGTVRLREIAVRAMIEATARARVDIAHKTRTRRSSLECDYKL